MQNPETNRCSRAYLHLLYTVYNRYNNQLHFNVKVLKKIKGVADM